MYIFTASRWTSRRNVLGMNEYEKFFKSSSQEEIKILKYQKEREQLSKIKCYHAVEFYRKIILMKHSRRHFQYEYMLEKWLKMDRFNQFNHLQRSMDWSGQCNWQTNVRSIKRVEFSLFCSSPQRLTSWNTGHEPLQISVILWPRTV